MDEGKESKDEKAEAPMTIEQYRKWWRAGSDEARADIAACLKSYRSKVKVAGRHGCHLLSMKPTKEGGYIQISWKKHNKLMTAHEAACILQNGPKPPSVEELYASHRCGKSDCCNPVHMVWETREQNEHRKYCHNRPKGTAKYIKCECCSNIIQPCVHNPICLVD